MGVLVGIVVGDSLWRRPLLFGSISVVAYSCLCLRCFEDECPLNWVASFFWFVWRFAQPQIMSMSYFLWWMLVGQLFCFDIGSWCPSAIFFWLAWCFFGVPGVRWPSDLVPKSGEPITFDSRSEVSSLVQNWFWAFLGVLSVDRRLCSGGGWLILEKVDVAHFGWWGLSFMLQGCSFGGE